MLDARWFAVRAEVDAHEVDARPLRRDGVCLAVVHRALPHPAQLRGSQGFRRHPGHGAPRAHLDEHEVRAILDNQVDLPTTSTHVPRDDAHPLRLQPVRRDPFSEVAERSAGGHHLNADWATGA